MDLCELNQNGENPQNGSKREADESDDEKYATIKKNKTDDTTKANKNTENFTKNIQKDHITTDEKSLKKDEALSNAFDMFCGSNCLSSIMENFQNLRDLAGISPQVMGLDVFWQLKTLIRSWKAENLWSRLDKKLSSEEYSNVSHAKKLNILVIGCGPCGLRMGIEGALLGHRVVMVEKREGFTRNNVLHLWSFLIHDLKALGAKLLFGRFCSGSIDHICIRTLQCILLKVALLLGVEVNVGVEFDQLIEPSDEGEEWGASFKPPSYHLNLPSIDVCVSADGRRNTMPKFKRLEFRGKLAIAITANFINNNTALEASVPEISGVSFIFKQSFFQKLCKQTGIDLENIVYYKDETHYFVMTAKKHSLLSKKVLLKDYDDPQQLLHKDNVDQQELLSYAFEAATFATEHKLPHLQFAINHNQQPDVAMFDFTSMYAAESASRAMEKHKKVLLLALVGDTLVEPFWPIGSGCGRGFLGVMDTAWMIRSWSLGTPLLHVVAERESAYQLLSQTTPENLNKNTHAFTIDPNSRYVNLQSLMMQPIQVKHLYEGSEDYIMSTCATSNYNNNNINNHHTNDNVNNNQNKNNNNNINSTNYINNNNINSTNYINNNNITSNNINNNNNDNVVNGDEYLKNVEQKAFYEIGDFREKLNGEETIRKHKKPDQTDSGLYVQTRDSYIRDLFKLSTTHKLPNKHPTYLPNLNTVANVAQHLGSGKQKSAEVTRLNTSVCFSCKQRVYLVQQLQVEGLTLHRNCFSCSYCRTALHKQHYTFNKHQGRFYCRHHKDLVRRDEEEEVVLPYDPPILTQENPFRLSSKDEDDWMNRPIYERAGYTTEDEGVDDADSSLMSLYDQFRSSSEEELQKLAYEESCDAPDLEWMMILRQHMEEKRRLRRLSNRGLEESDGLPGVEADGGRSSSEATVGASDADWETDDDDDSDDSDNDSRDNFQPSTLSVKNELYSQNGRRRSEEVKKDEKQNGGVISTQRKETSLHNRMSFFSAPTQPVRINARTFLGLDVPTLDAATNGDKDVEAGGEHNDKPVENNVVTKKEDVDENEDKKLSQSGDDVTHNVEVKDVNVDNIKNDNEDGKKPEETSVVSNEHINNKEDKKSNIDWSDEGRDGREVDMRKMMKQAVKKEKHKKVKHRTKKFTKRRKKNIKRLISGYSDKSAVMVDSGVKGNQNSIKTSHNTFGETLLNDNTNSNNNTTSLVTKAASFTNIATTNTTTSNSGTNDVVTDNNDAIRNNNEPTKTVSVDTLPIVDTSIFGAHLVTSSKQAGGDEIMKGDAVENVQEKINGVCVLEREGNIDKNNSNSNSNNNNKDVVVLKGNELERVKHGNDVENKNTTQINEKNFNNKVENITKNDIKSEPHIHNNLSTAADIKPKVKDDVFIDEKCDNNGKAPLVNGVVEDKVVKNQGGIVVKTEEIRRRNREIVTLSMSSDSVLDDDDDDASEVVMITGLGKDLELSNRLDDLINKNNDILADLKDKSENKVKDLLKDEVLKQNIDGTISSSVSTLTSETTNRCTLAASLLDDLIKAPPTPPSQRSPSRLSSLSENSIMKQSQTTTTTSSQTTATTAATTTTTALTNSQENKEENATNKLVSPSKLLDAKRRFFHEATQPVRIDPKSLFGDLSIRNAGSRSAKQLLDRLDGSKEKMMSKAEEAVKRIEDIIKNHDPFNNAGSSTDPVNCVPQKPNEEGSCIDRKTNTDSRTSTSSEDSQTMHEGRLIKYSPGEDCEDEVRKVVEEVQTDEMIKQQKSGLSFLSKILRTRQSNKPLEDLLRSKKKPSKSKSLTTNSGSKRWSYDGKSARKNDLIKRKINKKGMYRELAPMIEGIRCVEEQNNIKKKLESFLPTSHQLILPPKANLDDFETESEVGDDRCSIWSGHSDKSQLSEEERIKKRKKQLRIIRKKHKEKELIRMETLQEVMRQLHEVERQQVALEHRGVCIEKVLNRAEGMDEEEDEEELVQEWFHVVQQKNDLSKKESELVIQTRELQLEDRHCQLELHLQENIHNSDTSNKEMEGMLLQELMGVVEKRDKLVSLLEEERLRHKQYDSNLRSIMLQKGIKEVKTSVQSHHALPPT